MCPWAGQVFNVSLGGTSFECVPGLSLFPVSQVPDAGIQ